MSQTRTASPKPSRRRGGRSSSMAVDTRYAHIRRREQAGAPRFDWRDWLIPGGVIASLAYISAYHHATLIEAVGALL
jgi:hypothetical protein